MRAFSFELLITVFVDISRGREIPSKADLTENYIKYKVNH